MLTKKKSRPQGCSPLISTALPGRTTPFKTILLLLRAESQYLPSSAVQNPVLRAESHYLPYSAVQNPISNHDLPNLPWSQCRRPRKVQSVKCPALHSSKPASSLPTFGRPRRPARHPPSTYERQAQPRRYN